MKVTFCTTRSERRDLAIRALMNGTKTFSCYRVKLGPNQWGTVRGRILRGATLNKPKFTYQVDYHTKYEFGGNSNYQGTFKSYQTAIKVARSLGR